MPAIKDINNLFIRLPKDLDWRALWNEVMFNWFEYMKDAFGTEGANTGRKWKPLTPAYAARKAQEYPGKPILERTGVLRQAFTKPKSRYSKVLRKKYQLTIGPADVKYPGKAGIASPGSKYPMTARAIASHHQFGTVKMAGRPIVRITDEESRDLVNIFRKHAVDHRIAKFSRRFKTKAQRARAMRGRP
jgi:hypothetical protein